MPGTRTIKNVINNTVRGPFRWQRTQSLLCKRFSFCQQWKVPSVLVMQSLFSLRDNFVSFILVAFPGRRHWLLLSLSFKLLVKMLQWIILGLLMAQFRVSFTFLCNPEWHIDIWFNRFYYLYFLVQWGLMRTERHLGRAVKCFNFFPGFDKQGDGDIYLYFPFCWA